MPFVSNRGQRIHHALEGAGPLLVLQHGLLSRAANWKLNGFADRFADRYSVACVDLGHGHGAEIAAALRDFIASA